VKNTIKTFRVSFKNVFLIFITAFIVSCDGFQVNENISQPSTGIVSNVKSESASVRLGNRYYIKSVFTDIFLDGNESQSFYSQASEILNNEVFLQADRYGGPCSSYSSPECRSDLLIDYGSVSPHGFISARGDAGIIKACAAILDLNGVVESLSQKAQLSGTELNSANIEKAFKLFNPAKSISENSISGLLGVSRSLASTGSNNQDQWRMIYYTLCIDPNIRIP